MADGVDGKLEFQTLLNNDKLKSGIAEMGKIANKGAATIGKITKAGATATVAAIGTATTAATVLVKKSVENYAQYEQLVGGVETLFGAGGQSLEEYAASVGKSTDEVEDKYNSLMSAQTTVMADAANAYKTAGMSANDYMDTVTSFSASLVASLEGDTEKAADYSNRAITDMADNANKMGTNIQDIQHAYQGFAKQNYTMLDNLKLGYGGTKEEMQRLIADASEMTDVQEKLGLTVDSSSLSFGNIVNAISVMQENMGIAGTTAKEAATTIEGSVNMMKASWENLVTGMADDNADFDTLMQQFVDSTVTAADNLLPRIQIAIEGIGKLIEQLLPVIMDKVPQIIADTLPGLISAGISMVSALAQGIMDYAPQLISYAAELLVQFVQGLVTALPQIIEFAGELVQTLVTSFTEAAPQLMEAGSKFVSALGKGIVDNAPQFISYATQIIVQLVHGIVAALPKVIESGKTILSTLANSLIESAPDLIAAGKELIEFLVSGIAEALPDMVLGLSEMIIQAGQFLADEGPEIINWGFNMISQLLDGILSAIPVLIDQIPAIIQSLAEGFMACAPQLFIKGYELLFQLVLGLVSCIPDLIAKIPEVIAAIVETLIAYDWLGLGKQVITDVMNGMSQVWDMIVQLFTEKIPEFVDNWTEKFGELLDNIIDWGANVLENIGKTFSDMITTAVNFLSQLPGKIAYWLGYALGKVTKWAIELPIKASEAAINFVQNIGAFMCSLPEKIWSYLLQAVQRIINWRKNLSEKGKEAAKGLTDAVVNGIKNLPNKIKSIGKNIVSGLWNGIKGAWSGLVDKVSNLADNLLGGFKDALGIHSPSRKFKWVGEMCIAGMDEPIADYNPYDTLNKSIKANAGVMKANFVGSGSYAENYTAVYDYEAAAEATANALKGMTVNIDGRRAGKLLAPTIDKYQGEISQKRT